MTVVTLVGGPFDGDTMRFRPEQSTIVVPDGGDRLYTYVVCADGCARYEEPRLTMTIWVCPDHRSVAFEQADPAEGECYCPRCDMDRSEDAVRIWLAEVAPPADERQKP